MKKYFIAALTVLCLTVAPAAFSAEAEYTSISQVNAAGLGEDYKIQGEYIDEENHRGFQVIALGDMKFRVIGYQNALPGDGWDRSMARFFGNAEFDGFQVIITGEKMDIPRYENVEGKSRVIEFTDQMKQRKLRCFREGDNQHYYTDDKDKEHKRMKLDKVTRKSPTLGQAAPEGAVVIFDGTNLDMFRDGKMNEDAKTLWAEARTKPFEKDRPYLLHLEFMTSFMPKAQGQARSNSGVYINEAYECQVLDSFGLEGEDNECGGFYQFARPIVNMCYPPLTWQTYDIDFTPAKFADGKKVENARVTVRHNGVVIHDNLELEHETPGCLGEADEARGLYLQGHGNKCQYRNIWLQYK